MKTLKIKNLIYCIVFTVAAGACLFTGAVRAEDKLIKSNKGFVEFRKHPAAGVPREGREDKRIKAGKKAFKKGKFSSELSLKLDFPGAFLSRPDDNGLLRGEYDLLSLMPGKKAQTFTVNGSLYPEKLGEPNLAYARLMVRLPYSITENDLDISVNADYIQLDGSYDIAPVQEELPESFRRGIDKDNRVFRKKKEIYEADTYFKRPVEYRLITFHGVKIAEISFAPFQYNPVKKVLKVCETAELVIRFNAGTESDIYSPVSTGLVDDIIENSTFDGTLPSDDSSAPSSGGSSAPMGTLEVTGGTFVIVSHSESGLFDTTPGSAYADYIAYRVAQGYVHLTTIDTYDPSFDEPSEIRDELQLLYQDPGFDYLLLIGDETLVPISYEDGDGYHDNMYSRLDGGDTMPDVFMGRFLTDTEAGFRNILDHQIAQESGGIWTNDVMMAWGIEHSGGDPDLADRFSSSHYSTLVMDHPDAWLSYNVHRYYKTAISGSIPSRYGGYYSYCSIPEAEFEIWTLDPDPFYVNSLECTNAIIDGWNAHVALIGHRDHGNITGPSSPSIRYTIFSGDITSDCSPLFTSTNCLSGDFKEKHSNNFAYQSQVNTLGTCATFAATVVTYSGDNDYYHLAMYDAMFPEYPDLETSVRNVGEIFLSGLLAGQDHSRTYFHIYGDPMTTLSLSKLPDAKGMVRFEENFYNLLDTEANIVLFDANLGLPTAMVSVSSDLTGAFDIDLNETGPSTGVFTGSVGMSTSGVPDTLEISHGDQIYVAYHDDDDGTGQPYDDQDTAVIDGVPPSIISGPSTSFPYIEIGGNTGITVEWQTDELTTSIVYYDESSLFDSPLTAELSDYVTEHSVEIQGLSADTTYYYAVESQDRAGNIVYDDNQGGFYQFIIVSPDIQVESANLVGDSLVLTIPELSSTSETLTISNPAGLESVNLLFDIQSFSEPWISASPTEGELEPGYPANPEYTSIPVEVLIDASGLSAGNYTEEIDIENNSLQNPLTIEVELTTTARAIIRYEDHFIIDNWSGGSFMVNGDGKLNPGERIELQIEVENIGSLDAADVSATLATTDPYITILDDAVDFGDVDAGASVLSLDNFLIEADVDTPGSRMVTFTLEITDSGNQWDEEFQLAVIELIPASDIRLDTDEPGDKSSEYPRISSDDNGGVYAVWDDARGIYYNYSRDFGATWLDDDIRPSSVTAYVSYPQISSDNIGNIYVAWQDKRNDPNPYDSNDIYDIYFNYSTDYGATWLTSDIQITTDVTIEDSVQHQINSDDNGNVYVVWVGGDYAQSGQPNNMDIYFNYSHDYGATWSSDIRLNTDDLASYYSFNPKISLGNNGYVYVVWRDGRGIYYNYSQDYGVTWQDPDILVGGGGISFLMGQLQICSDDNGGVYVVLSRVDYDGGVFFGIYFNYSTDHGATWQASYTRLDGGTGTSRGSPQVSCDNNGNIYAVWQDSRGGGEYDIYFNYSTDYGDTWQGEMRLDTDGLGTASSRYPQVSFDNNGGVYVVWQDNRNGEYDIYFNYSIDYGATWQASDIRLDKDTAGAASSENPQISSDDKRDIYVVWQDGRNGEDDIYFIPIYMYMDEELMTLDTIGNKQVIEEELLEFTVTATNLNGTQVELSLETQGLLPGLQDNMSDAEFPLNTEFDSQTGETTATFRWTPDPNTAGIYDPVVFVARDPSTERCVYQAVTIEVLERVVMGYKGYSVIDDWSGGSFMVNGDGELNSGERVELRIKVENTGPKPAQGVSAILSLLDDPDSHITILDDTIDFFGDILAGASVWSSNNFLIEAADTTPDDYTVTFALDIRDSGQRLWCEEFQITVTISSTDDIRVNDASITAASINPQISSDDSGNTYIVWQDYRNGNSDIYFNYSTNDGVTWQSSDTRIDTAPGYTDSRNPQISSDNVGRVYVAWEDRRNGNYDVYFNYSTDYGVTWQASDIQLDTGTANSEKVQIRSDNSGHVYVMWQDPRNGYPDIYFNSSSNYGATWQGESRLDTDPAGEGWSWHAHMSSDNSGNVYVVWEDGRSGSGHLFFNYSQDYGATWQLSDIDINGDGGLWLPRISCGTDGKVYVTCTRGSSTDIYFNYSTDYGAAGTWQSYYRRVNTGPIGIGDAGRQQISSDDNGNIYVVWEDKRDGDYDIYFNYSTNYGVTWQSSDIRLDRTTAGTASSFTPQISSDDNGGVYVVWQDYRNENNDIYFNYSTDFGATWQSNDIRLDTDAAGTASSENPQISSNNSGGVYVAWQDNRDGQYDIYFVPIDINEGFTTLNTISDQEAMEGVPLEFEVTATNAGGTQLELFFDIQGLTPGLQANMSNATFTTEFNPPTTTGTFKWTPNPGTADTYYPVVFVARDPLTDRYAYRAITITVSPAWVLNMTEMEWYQNAGLYNSTGAAVSQMILNYIRVGADEPTLNQNEIYEYARNPLDPDGTELNPNQMDKVLGHFDPYDYLVSNYYDGYDSRPGGNPYQGYNYTIDTYNPLEMNEYMRDVCHWMAYTVTKGNWWNPNAELVARPNTPAAVPIYGTYDHWVAVKGCVTSENPVPNPRGDPWAGSDFTVYGFWMKDPLITGIGQNTYKTAAECQSTYFQPLATGDAYDGLLLQIAEPPARFSNEGLEITGNTEIKKHTRDLANLEFVGVEVKTSDYEDSSLLMALSSSDRVSLERDTHPIIKKESWRDLVDSYLLTDSEAVAAFEGAKMGKPILVDRVDEASDYYLVPFGKRARRRFLTSAVIILDADEGYFKEASWTDEPERFLKINKRRARWLVRRGIVRDLINELRSLPRRPLRRYYRQRRRIFRQYIRLIRYIRRAQANLIWQPNSYSTSPYEPYWKVNINGRIWYVTQEGKVIPLQIDR